MYHLTHAPTALLSVGWRTGRPTRRGIEAMADGSQPVTELAVRRPHRPCRQKRARRGCTERGGRASDTNLAWARPALGRVRYNRKCAHQIRT